MKKKLSFTIYKTGSLHTVGTWVIWVLPGTPCAGYYLVEWNGCITWRKH